MTSDIPDKAPSKKMLMIGATLIAAICLIWVLWIVFHPGEVRTNDAQIDGHIHPINSRIAGTVIWLNPTVDDTHFVKAGTVLARLDPNDYQPSVDRLAGDVQASEAQLQSSVLSVPITTAAATSKLIAARAAVEDAESELLSAEAQKDAAEAAVRQAVATYHRAENDRVRYEALVTTHEISRSEYDLRATDAKTSQALLSAAEANRNAAEQKIASSRQKLVQRKSDERSAETAPQVIASARANVERAGGDLQRSRAALFNARLDLGYTNVIAPVDGIIGKKGMEVGQRILSGQLLLTLVPPNDTWAIANFRETQLHHMKVGQRATIHVDSYGKDVDGTVESIGGATGSKYSLIAPDNATGNYVKVVQRVPVRIRLDQNALGDQRLLPGMSIEVSVHIGK
jgi:membrane fusion protein (multidrug efflux system)